MDAQELQELSPCASTVASRQRKELAVQKRDTSTHHTLTILKAAFQLGVVGTLDRRPRRWSILLILLILSVHCGVVSPLEWCHCGLSFLPVFSRVVGKSEARVMSLLSVAFKCRAKDSLTHCKCPARRHCGPRDRHCACS
jgi:hypothetical protein